MKWNRYTIQTISDAVDLISAELSEIGIQGIEIIDNKPITQEEAGAMFIDSSLEGSADLLPKTEPDDGTAQVNFYLEPEEDQEKILEEVEEVLTELASFTDIGEGTIRASETEDKDWINNWKKYWHTFTIGTLVIKPTWEEVPEQYKGQPVLSIDPGTAFGTGSHETTRLVIRELQNRIKGGEEVLDVGTGSGILSIVALKYGAKHALGTDLDPNAIIATDENAEQNEIDKSQLDVILGDIVTDEKIQEEVGFEKYDIVCANILHDVLIPLSGEITKHMKPGAFYITSGIINTRENQVKEAIEANPELEILSINHDGEWVNITARKKA